MSTPDFLRAAEVRALPEDVTAAVRAHRDRCPLCRMVARDLSQISQPELTNSNATASTRVVSSQTGGAPRDRPRWWPRASRMFGPAVGGALAASLVFALINRSAGPQPDVRTPSLPAIASVVRPSVLTPDKPVLRLPLATLVSLRGAPDTRAADIREGLVRYRENDFRRAAEHSLALFRIEMCRSSRCISA